MMRTLRSALGAAGLLLGAWSSVQAAPVSLEGFRPSSFGTPIAVTTGGVTGSLPAGSVVIATNVGTTNGAYCALGASGATTAQYIAPNGGWFAFQIRGDTQLTCITSSSTTTVNLAGGSGWPPAGTGGGGGGGGGGGAITAASGSYASGAFAVGSGTDGWDVGVGATTATAATVGSAGSVNAKLRLITSQLDTIASNTAGPVPAGSASIGTVGLNAGSNLVGSVNVAPAASGGLTTFFLQPTASDNHTNIKNGAGMVFHVAVTNNSATINYLRFYNAATGFNGCNSATNLVYQLAIPASTSGAGFVEDISMGLVFSAGISICVTSGYASNDATNATASAMSLLVGYK